MLAGGDNKYIILYHVPNRLLLRKFIVSRNKKFDGITSVGQQRTSEGNLSTFDLDENDGGTVLDDKWDKKPNTVSFIFKKNRSNLDLVK